MRFLFENDFDRKTVGNLSPKYSFIILLPPNCHLCIHVCKGIIRIIFGYKLDSKYNYYHAEISARMMLTIKS